MVAAELEVMAKKLDRFGWDRDRNTEAHDRLMLDWMDALADYPLDEVKAACREWIRTNPRKMCHEGDIFKIIMADRKRRVAAFKASRPANPDDRRNEPRVTKEQANESLERANFKPRRPE